MLHEAQTLLRKFQAPHIVTFKISPIFMTFYTAIHFVFYVAQSAKFTCKTTLLNIERQAWSNITQMFDDQWIFSQS